MENEIKSHFSYTEVINWLEVQRHRTIRQSFQNIGNRLSNRLQAHCLFPKRRINLLSIRHKPKQGNIINWANWLRKDIIDELNEIPNS